MPSNLTPETSWVVLPGKTLAEVEAAAIRACFIRHDGDRTRMRAELQISKSNLLLKLDKMGLRGDRASRTRHLTERAISLSFFRHCRAIMKELGIHESTLMRWINKRAPFAVAAPPSVAVEEK